MTAVAAGRHGRRRRRVGAKKLLFFFIFSSLFLLLLLLIPFPPSKFRKKLGLSLDLNKEQRKREKENNLLIRDSAPSSTGLFA